MISYTMLSKFYKIGQLTIHHALVSTISNGKNVRGYLVPSFVDVHSNDCFCVDRKSLVWIDSNTK